MLTEADFGTKRLVAEFACERPFAVVRSAGVHFQTVRRGEHLVAFDAAVHVAVAATHQQVVVVRVRRVVGRRTQQVMPQPEQFFGGGRMRRHARKHRVAAAACP